MGTESRNRMTRTVWRCYSSAGSNLLFAAFKFVLAARSGSLWFGILGGYYAVLGLSGFLLLNARRRAMHLASPSRREAYLLRAYRSGGTAMVTLAAVLLAAVRYLVVRDEVFPFVFPWLYGVVGFTAYKVLWSAVNLCRVRPIDRFDRFDPALRAARNVGFADAAVSVLAAETYLLSVFWSDAARRRLYNALCGGFVCLGILSVGVGMLLRARYKLQNAPER